MSFKYVVKYFIRKTAKYECAEVFLTGELEIRLTDCNQLVSRSNIEWYLVVYWHNSMQ